MRIRVRFCRRQNTFHLLFSYFRLFYEMFSHKKKMFTRSFGDFYFFSTTSAGPGTIDCLSLRENVVQVRRMKKKNTRFKWSKMQLPTQRITITMGPFFYDFSLNSMRIRFLIVLRKKNNIKKRFSFVYRIGLLFVRACLYADGQTKLYSRLLLFTFLCLENINLNKNVPFPFRLFVRKLIKIKK